MNYFQKINILLIIVFVLNFFFFLSQSVYANANLYENYSKLFYEYGFEVDLPLNRTDSPNEFEKTDEVKIKNLYDLYFASQDPKLDTLEKNRTLILICDKTIQIAGTFSCGTDFVISETEDSISKIFEQKLSDNVSIYTTDLNGTALVIIPELNFVENGRSKFIESYFKSIYNYYKPGLQQESLFEKRLETVSSTIGIDSKAVYIFGYALFILFIASLLKKLIVLLADFPKSVISVNSFIAVLVNIQSTIRKFRPVYIHFVLILILFYIPLVLIIMHIDNYPVTLLADYFVQLLQVNNLLYSVEQNNISTMLFFSYNLILIFFIVLCVVPNVLDLIIYSLRRINSVTLKHKPVSYLFVGTMLWIITLIAFNGLNFQLIFFALFTATIVYGLLIINYFKINLSTIFSKNQKLLVILIIPSLIFLGILYNEIKEPYKEQRRLFNDDNKYIVLPVTKSASSETYFEDLNIKPQIPIFVNNYLIYHPNFKSITHANINEFHQKNENYIILKPSTVDDLAEQILLNSELGAILSESSVAEFVSLVINTVSEYELEIEYDCSSEVEKHEFKVKPYYVPDDTSHVIKDNARIKVLDFYGCHTGEKSTSYRVPLNVSEIPDGELLLRLEDHVLPHISSLKIFENGLPISQQYFSGGGKGDIYKSNLTTNNDAVTVYLFDSNTDLHYENSQNEDFNLSGAINYLREQNLVGEEFKIWTDSVGHVVLDL